MGESQATAENPADNKRDAEFHPVMVYVRQLTPSARSHLLAELERLELSGEAIPGCDTLLQKLRAEFRGSAEIADDRAKSPLRYFFQPIESSSTVPSDGCMRDRSRAARSPQSGS